MRRVTDDEVLVVVSRVRKSQEFVYLSNSYYCKVFDSKFPTLLRTNYSVLEVDVRSICSDFHISRSTEKITWRTMERTELLKVLQTFI